MKIPGIPTVSQEPKPVPQDNDNDDEVAAVLDQLIAEGYKELSDKKVFEVWSMENQEDGDYDGYDYEDTIKY